MQTTSTTSLREVKRILDFPVRAGQREARAIGEDLTRQGRLRMDAFQTERRLKSAYSTLGEIVYQDLSDLRSVNVNNPHVIEVLAHIRYYQDELERLKSEMSAGRDMF